MEKKEKTTIHKIGISIEWFMAKSQMCWQKRATVKEMLKVQHLWVENKSSKSSISKYHTENAVKMTQGNHKWQE